MFDIMSLFGDNIKGLEKKIRELKNQRDYHLREADNYSLDIEREEARLRKLQRSKR